MACRCNGGDIRLCGQTAEVLKPRNLTLVPNGVALDRFRSIPRPAPAATFRLLNVARFIPFKGQDVLIEALHICAGRGLNLNCTFVGTIADQEFYDRLQTQVERHGLRSRVRFEVGRSDVETFMAKADAFVLSSRDEGFGVALVEAMAGLPVISAKVGGAAEIVQDGISGLRFLGFSDPLILPPKDRTARWRPDAPCASDRWWSRARPRTTTFAT